MGDKVEHIVGSAVRVSQTYSLLYSAVIVLAVAEERINIIRCDI